MGKKIENYILESVVGSGEFGKVYKAYNEKNNQVVAIKVIQIEKFRLSPKLQEFTINEINTLSKIEDSTHIVRFIEILKTANNYYFVYEFCNDGTLEERIKSSGRFSEEQALKYFAELLSAFRMLVKSNIMHRDIKPSNILLNNGVIKLADFGFCKPMKDSKDLAQTMLGSPIYMAPQILKGQIYTMKADIWSLGVVLYEMLYGFCPFEERSIARLINLIEEGTVEFPKDIKVSKSTEDLLRKMLVKDQFKRIEWWELLEYKNEANCLVKQPYTDKNKSFETDEISNQDNLFKKPAPKMTKQASQHQLNETFTAPNYNIHENPFAKKNDDNRAANPFTKKQFQSTNPGEGVHNNRESNHSSGKRTAEQTVGAKNRSNTRHRNLMHESKSKGKSPERERPKRSNTVHQHQTLGRNVSNTSLLGRGAKNEQKDQSSVQNKENSQKRRSAAEDNHRQKENSNYGSSNQFTKQVQQQRKAQGALTNINQNICNFTPQSISSNNTPTHAGGVGCYQFKKTVSSNSSAGLLPDADKKVIQSILEKRVKIQKGVKMIGQFLSQSSSKLSVNICAFIARKIKNLSHELGETAKKYSKETDSPKSKRTAHQEQLCATLKVLLQETEQIGVKLRPFEQILCEVHEPQDIIFLRYGEEEHLTQQKEGLSQLLMIDDYLHISSEARQNSDRAYSSSFIETGVFNAYSSKPKRELLEEYERRILRNV